MSETAATNIPEYSVSEIGGAVKRALEGAFGRVRVRGEITECRPNRSGHIYLSLKDEGGKLGCVIWKTTVPRLGLRPEDGIEVVATGRITTYGDQSKYQLTIDRLEYAGAGAMLARIEALRQLFIAEGLFEAARKVALPRYPGLIGVVTSPQGAVLHDILTTIERRMPGRLLIWPVPVQGEGSAARVAAAIAGFDACTGDQRPDVLIVARGGGSLEDLMAFNDELVVRAAAACSIPLISAIGHETDTTLLDLVADRRAPTPTAAAEMAVCSRTELLDLLARDGLRLSGAVRHALQTERHALDRAGRALPELPKLLAEARQRVDDRGDRLGRAFPVLIASRRYAFERAERRLPDLPARLREARSRLAAAGMLETALPHLIERRRADLRHAVARIPSPAALIEFRRTALARLSPLLSRAQARLRTETARTLLAAVSARLESVSYQGVLARGYAVVRDRAGAVLTGAEAARSAGALTIEFRDGHVPVLPDSGSSGPEKPKRRLGGQGSLL